MILCSRHKRDATIMVKNLPYLRRELQHGIPITDENDNRLGESTKAAQQAISQVVVSRILMASPGMGRPRQSASTFRCEGG